MSWLRFVPLTATAGQIKSGSKEYMEGQYSDKNHPASTLQKFRRRTCQEKKEPENISVTYVFGDIMFNIPCDLMFQFEVAGSTLMSEAKTCCLLRMDSIPFSYFDTLCSGWYSALDHKDAPSYRLNWAATTETKNGEEINLLNKLRNVINVIIHRL